MSSKLSALKSLMVSQQELMNKLYKLMKEEPTIIAEPTKKAKTIIELVNQEFNTDCTQSNKRQSTSDARSVAMYLMSKHTKMTLLEIGLCVGRGHHTTVMAGRQKVVDRMRFYPDFKEVVERIESKLI